MLKMLLATTAVGLSAILFGGAAGTVWMVSGGIAMVSVDTEEVDFFLPIPTRIVDLGLDATELALPVEERRQFQEQLHRDLEMAFDDDQLAETLHDVVHALRDMPAGEYVHVRSDTEEVKVGKRRGKLYVRVDTPDAKVRVSVPARAASRIGERTLAMALP
jgi:hypothetical protein